MRAGTPASFTPRTSGALATLTPSTIASQPARAVTDGASEFLKVLDPF
jgi:hypothetical protein